MHLGKPPSFGISGTCKGQAWGSKGFVLHEISGSTRGKKKMGVTQSKTMEVED
jgi:hypothetical protein